MKHTPCPVHDACTAIYLPAKEGEPSFDFDGQRVCWVSHAHADLHVDCRTAKSGNPCGACRSHPAWPS